jgi:hypothetical protein
MVAKNNNPDMSGRGLDDEPEEEESRLANRALRPGESVYQPSDGSPAIILRPGEKPPASLAPPPPPMYDGQPWTPPVQPWDAAAAAAIRCTAPGCMNKRATGTRSTLCKRHRRIKEQLGDVNAIRIAKTRVARYLTLAKTFMAPKTPRNLYGHLSDENVQEALTVMRGLLWVSEEGPAQFNKSFTSAKHGATSPEYLLWKELRRLQRPPIVANKKGVPRGGSFPKQPDPRGPLKAVEALTHVLAWWLLFEMGPELTRDPLTVDTRNVMLGRAVLGLRHQATNGRNPLPINGAAMKLLGEKIVGRNEREGELTRFLVTVTETVRADERDKLERRERLNRKPSSTRAPTTPTVNTVRRLLDEAPAQSQPPTKESPQRRKEELLPSLCTTLTPEQLTLAKAPWTPDERRAFEAECRNIGRRPEEYDARTQTNWLRKRRGLPLLPAKPPEHRPWAPPPPPVQAYQPR